MKEEFRMKMKTKINRVEKEINIISCDIFIFRKIRNSFYSYLT